MQRFWLFLKSANEEEAWAHVIDPIVTALATQLETVSGGSCYSDYEVDNDKLYISFVFSHKEDAQKALEYIKSETAIKALEFFGYVPREIEGEWIVVDKEKI